MHLRKAEKPSNPYQQSSSKNLVRLLILIIIGLVGFIVYQQPQANDSIERKNSEELAKHIEKENSFARQLKEAHEEKVAAEQSRHELELQLRGSKDKHDKSNGGSKDLKEMETIIELVVKKVNTLEKAMQNKAKKEIIEK
jgi:hypothetical protein